MVHNKLKAIDESAETGNIKKTNVQQKWLATSSANSCIADESECVVALTSFDEGFREK